MALSHLPLQPTKHFINCIQKGSICGQEKEPEGEGCEPLDWNPLIDVYIRINGLDIKNFLERYVIKYYDVVTQCVVKPNIVTVYLEEF